MNFGVKKSFDLINVSDHIRPSEKFLDLDTCANSRWHMFSGVPSNFIESKINRPKIARYRAVLQAIGAARSASNPVFVSHLPNVTAALATYSQFGCGAVPHLAFAFNFTDLPGGLRMSYMRGAFKRVQRFVVFSDFEKNLYADIFGIPEKKIVSILWAQEPPPVSIDIESPFPSTYLCAIGGEGRDFRCLIEAARISRLPLVIVSRPASLGGLEIPKNVKVFYNLPLADTWGLAAKSCGVVVPLKSRDTCCGQITVVSAEMLGLPIITNASHALQGYLSEINRPYIYEPGNSEDLAGKMALLVAGQGCGALQYADAAGAAIAKFSRSYWINCVERFLHELS